MRENRTRPRWPPSATSLRCETVIIPEMTARRLITHAARYFLLLF
jgi:hypothetical protein